MNKRFVSSAIAVLAIGLVALPASADARGVHTRSVRLQDRCDPDSFNAAIPSPPGQPPTCIPHGGQKTVTFAAFVAKLNPVDFGHPKWNNHPDEIDLRSGDEISVTVRGGEFHTFTEVPEFGPGCVPFINGALGLTGPAPTDAQCGEFFATTGVAPDGMSTLTVAGLSDGMHLFMCEIHPWMRSVVNVGDDDD
jgi:plastocyanin